MYWHWFDAHGNQLPARPLLLLSLILLLSACAALPKQAAPTDDAVRIENPTARPARAGQNSAAYFTIVNPTGEEDQLLSVTSAVAMVAELHETQNDNGVMRMVHQADGVAVPARSTVDFVPGGKHVMLMNLRQDLAAGQRFTITLSFAKAGEIEVTVPVPNTQ
jgi:copper(I)-binding protein